MFLMYKPQRGKYNSSTVSILPISHFCTSYWQCYLYYPFSWSQKHVHILEGEDFGLKITKLLCSLP